MELENELKNSLNAPRKARRAAPAMRQKGSSVKWGLAWRATGVPESSLFQLRMVCAQPVLPYRHFFA